MQRLRDLGIRAKILVPLGLVAVLAAVAVGLALARTWQLTERMDRVRSHHAAALLHLDQVRSGLGRANADQVSYLSLLAVAPAGIDAAEQYATVRADDAVADDAMARYERLAGDSRRGQIAEYRSAVRRYRDLRAALYGVRPASGADVPRDPGGLMRAVDAATGRLDDAVAALVAAEDRDAAAAASECRAQYRTTALLIAAAVVVGLAATVAGGRYLAESIARPLRQVRAGLDAIAAGDLAAGDLAPGGTTGGVGVERSDEIGQLARSADRAAGRIRTTVRSVAAGAAALAAGTARLAETGAVTTRSAEVASARAAGAVEAVTGVADRLRAVVARAERVDASVRQIARSADDGAAVAERAVTVARSANDTIAGLGDSSARIGAIVSTVTGIAGQTNLLALNATIEAAHAGDAGKGFAVVAGEVKELARETAQATGDISLRVSAIQEDSGRAAAAIGAIGEIIERISAYQRAIATTAERTVGDSAGGDGTLGGADLVGSVTAAAEAVGATATRVLSDRDAAVELARLADELAAAVAGLR